MCTASFSGGNFEEAQGGCASASKGSLSMHFLRCYHLPAVCICVYLSVVFGRQQLLCTRGQFLPQKCKGVWFHVMGSDSILRPNCILPDNSSNLCDGDIMEASIL